MTIEDDIYDLKEYTRAAHAAIKDLKALNRETKALIQQIPEVVKKEFDVHMRVAVEAGLEGYMAAIMKSIDEAEERVYERFEVIGNLLLGETKGERRSGEPSLTEIAEAIAAEKGQHVADGVVVVGEEHILRQLPDDVPLHSERAAHLIDRAAHLTPPQIRVTHEEDEG